MAAACFLVALIVQAQDPLHRRYEVKDGLPSNTVYAALQDRDGYVWFATDAGVCRFDGHTFETFTVDDGLTDNDVLEMAEDSRGRIWLLTVNGRLCYLQHGTVHRTEQEPRKGHARASAGWQSFTEDRHGRLWFGGIRDECLRLDPQGGYDTLYRFVGSKISVVRDERGEALVINGGAVVRQGPAGRFEQLPWTNDLFFRPVHRQAEDGSGRVLSVGPDGIHTLVDHRWELTHPLALRSQLHNLAWIDRVGDVWIRSSEGGVDHLPQGKVDQHRVLFPDHVVNDVLVDDRGGRWFCTSGRGVLYSPAGQFRAVVHKVRTGSEEDPVRTLLVLGPDSLLAGTASGQVLRFHGRWSGPLRLDHPGRVLDMERDAQGGVWFACDQTLGHWPGRGDVVHDVGGRLSEVDTLTVHPRGISKSVAVAPQGRIWCGSFGLQEVVRTGQGVERRPRWDLPVRERVQALHATSNDSLWFATDGTLQLLSGAGPARLELGDPSAGAVITDIASGAAGHLFVATAGAGLFQVDPAGLVVAHLTQGHGLPSNQVVRVRAQGDTLLVVTDRGLMMVPLPLDGHGTKVVFRSDLSGLQVSDAAFMGGQLVAATDQGLCILPRHLLAEPSLPPRLTLQGLWVQGLPRTQSDTLRLREGQAQVRVAFRAIEFAEPERVEYAYALDPAGPWTPARTGAIDLTSLAPGRHQLAVKARVGEGPWSAPRQLALTVAPLWWNRTEARLLLAAALLALLVLGTYLLASRRYRAELALLRQREAVNEERRRIAADVHDDLGADLSSLLLHARQAQSRPEPVALQRVTEGIGRAVSKIDEIIWSLDPRRDTLQATVAFVEQQLAELLGMAGIAFRSAIDCPGAPVPLAAEARRNILLLLREAARNVVKHAHATEVWLRCERVGDHVHLVLEDNGTGPGTARTAGRSGWTNMRERAARLGGTLHIAPATPSGTRVELRFAATGITRSDDARSGANGHISP